MYFAFYIPYFTFLNRFTPARANAVAIYCRWDDAIPFLEWFVIPYVIWFGYIAAVYIFFLLVSREEFIRLCLFLYGGMTLCLLIYTVFPNYQFLRADYAALGRDNYLIQVLRMMQSVDAPYNVFPSIHCLNAVGAHIALCKSKKLGKSRKVILCASSVLMILIILSTVFVKQHSILDVIGAGVIAVPLYFLAYKIKRPAAAKSA